jgi:hypothetical protein
MAQADRIFVCDIICSLEKEYRTEHMLQLCSVHMSTGHIDALELFMN